MIHREGLLHTYVSARIRLAFREYVMHRMGMTIERGGGRGAAREEEPIRMPRACVRGRRAACRSARLAAPILSSRGLL